jgi:hypothetical protein
MLGILMLGNLMGNLGSFGGFNFICLTDSEKSVAFKRRKSGLIELFVFLLNS